MPTALNRLAPPEAMTVTLMDPPGSIPPPASTTSSAIAAWLDSKSTPIIVVPAIFAPV
jgi:hypothetical protein